MANEILQFMTDEYKKRSGIMDGGSKVRFMELGVPKTATSDECHHYYILMNVENGERLCDDFFEEHGKFVDGVAPVRVEEEWGYIKENGEYLVKPSYEEASESVNGVLRMVDCDGFVDLRSAITGELLSGAGGYNAVYPYWDEEKEFLDSYVVQQEGYFGILDAKGQWLMELRPCKEVYPMTETLAYVKFADGRGELHCLTSRKLLISQLYLDFRYFEEYGIIFCRDVEERLMVYQWFKTPRLGDQVKLLFAEFAEKIVIDSEDIIQLHNGETNLWSMFSISNMRWMHSGMLHIIWYEEIRLYSIGYENNSNIYGELLGITDEHGELLIPPELEVIHISPEFNGMLMAGNSAGWGIYNPVEKKWLFLPQANLVKPLKRQGAFALGKYRRGLFSRGYIWRYFVDGRFISDYDFTTCFDFEEVDGTVRAKVRHAEDGRKNWICLNGAFYDEKWSSTKSKKK